jgi:hypothetical protein
MVQPRAEGRREIAAGSVQAEALQELVRGAERSVRILSDALDPDLFDHEALAAELSRLVRGGRQCEVRILVKDSHNLVKRSHHLGTLHRRLVSSVQVRKLSQFPEHYVANYVVVDDRGILYLPMVDDKSGFVNADDRPLAKHCAEQFDELWSRSGPDPELRVMPM